MSNENEQISRGEQSLKVKEEFQKATIQSSSESEKAEVNAEKSDMYVQDNSELDSFLDESTTTQEQIATEKKNDIAAQTKYMSIEQAMDISLKGLAGFNKLASDYTGKALEVSQSSAMLFATLTAPLVQKYGSKISLDPANVDLDSWMPEMMALGGVAVVGYPMFKQAKEPVIKNKKSEKGEGNGD